MLKLADRLDHFSWAGLAAKNTQAAFAGLTQGIEKGRAVVGKHALDQAGFAFIGVHPTPIASR